MDMRLSDHDEEWRTRARDYAREFVAPRAPKLDAKTDPAKAFSWQLVEEADTRGLRLAPLPADFRGGETRFLCNAVMLEEIAAADLGVSVILAQTWKFAQLLMEVGTGDQRSRWLRRLADNPRGLMAASFTEPEAGSDNILPYDEPDGGMRTSAERVDGGWVLNGTKRYISNSNRSSIILAYARTDPSVEVRKGVSCFIVPSDGGGVNFGHVHDKIGERLANNSVIEYRDVFVPQEDLLGTENTALADVATLLRGSNAYAAACTLGVARAAFDRAFRYAKERVQGGRPIIEHDAIGMQLGDMYSQLEMARTYVFRAAWAADHLEHFDPKMAAAPKLVASEISFDVTRRALEIFGGAGVMRDVGIEKLLRDATVFLHSDGTNTIMRKKLAEDLRGHTIDGTDDLWSW